MRQNLLRLGFALLLLCALLPASAEARSGPDRPTASADWSAGPVHLWTGYHRQGGSRRVRELQRRLNALGYRAGRVDGLFGPRTRRATRRFQRRNGLRADAVAGPRTLRALRRDDERRRQAPTRGAERPSVPAPHATPERIAPEPTPTRIVERPSPDLPVAAVLIAFAVLGLASLLSSYLRTTARIRRAQSEARSGRPRAPTLTGEPGR